MIARENSEQRLYIFPGRGFVERNADGVTTDVAQVNFFSTRCRHEKFGGSAGVHRNGIEKMFGRHLIAEFE